MINQFFDFYLLYRFGTIQETNDNKSRFLFISRQARAEMYQAQTVLG